MIPDSKIETTQLLWDTSQKSPGYQLENELNQSKLQFQSPVLPQLNQNSLSA